MVDGGPDSAVELGVKFRSDVAGTITGIRFYKATANTGTHVGNLWTSTGTLLATATFTNETASGWQQVLFATPVAIASNTVYVASYHANNGHYSADVNYFSAKGVDNPPLHALTNGVSGGNGVYAYGTSSAFPNQTWNAANYWVDVVFQAGSPPPPTLTSIAVTPANSSIFTGASQQFTATGTYSDGSTQNLTSQATWTSSNTGVATINAGGLATGVSAGTTTISAALTGVTGSTDADGAIRAARHHDDLPAQRSRERGLHGDVDGQRRDLAVHLVDCQRVSAPRPDAQSQPAGPSPEHRPPRGLSTSPPR